MGAIAWTTVKNAWATAVRAATGLPADRIKWAGQPGPVPATHPTLPWVLLGRFVWTNPGNDWTQYESNPLSFTPKLFTLNALTDQATSDSHDLQTRDGPVRLETTGSLVGTGLSADTDYWIIRDADDRLKFASSFLDANDLNFIDILGNGTGIHTIVSTDATRRAGQELREAARGARRVQFDIQCFPAIPGLDQPVDDDVDPVTVLSDIVAKFQLAAIRGPLQEAGIGILDPGEPQAVDGVLNNVYFEPRAVMTVAFSTTSEVTGTETVIEYFNVEDEDRPPSSGFDDGFDDGFGA